MSLHRIALVSTAFVAAAGMVATASAQTIESMNRCGPRTEMLKQLSSLYREQPVALGIADTGTLLEVVAANDGATWTVMVTRSDGTSCVIMTGESWQGDLHQNLAQLQHH